MVMANGMIYNLVNCIEYFVVVVLPSAALEVELSDDSFPPEDFGIVSGMLNVKWDRIAPYPPKINSCSVYPVLKFS